MKDLHKQMKKLARWTALKKTAGFSDVVIGAPELLSTQNEANQTYVPTSYDVKQNKATKSLSTEWSKIKSKGNRRQALQLAGSLLHEGDKRTPGQLKQYIADTYYVPDSVFDAKGGIKDRATYAKYFNDFRSAAEKKGISAGQIYRVWNEINTPDLVKNRQKAEAAVSPQLLSWTQRHETLKQRSEDLARRMGDPQSQVHRKLQMQQMQALARQRAQLNKQWKDFSWWDKARVGGWALKTPLMWSVFGPEAILAQGIGAAANQGTQQIVDIANNKQKAATSAMYKGIQEWKQFARNNPQLAQELKQKYNINENDPYSLAYAAQQQEQRIRDSKEKWGTYAEIPTWVLGQRAISAASKGALRTAGRVARKAAPNTYSNFILRHTPAFRDRAFNYSSFIRPNPQNTNKLVKWFPGGSITENLRGSARSPSFVWNIKNFDTVSGGQALRQNLMQHFDPLNKPAAPFFTKQLGGNIVRDTIAGVALGNGARYAARQFAPELVQTPTQKSVDQVQFELRNMSPEQRTRRALTPPTVNITPESGTGLDRLKRIWNSFKQSYGFSGNNESQEPTEQEQAQAWVLNPNGTAAENRNLAYDIALENRAQQEKYRATGSQVKEAKGLILSGIKQFRGKKPEQLKQLIKNFTGKLGFLSEAQLARIQAVFDDPEASKQVFSVLPDNPQEWVNFANAMPDIPKDQRLSPIARRSKKLIQAMLTNGAAYQYQTGLGKAEDKFAYIGRWQKAAKEIQKKTGISFSRDSYIKQLTNQVVWDQVTKNPLNIHKALALMAYQADFENVGDFLNNPLAFYGMIAAVPLTVMLMKGLFGGGDNKQQPQQQVVQPLPVQYSIANRGLMQ